MAALSGRQELATFGEILTIDTSNAQVVDTTERPVVSGDGTASALKISTTTVSSTGLLIGRGTFGSGTAMPDSGARTGFYWYPKKAAIVGGYVASTQWDDASIGNYAINLGKSNTTSGTNSSSIGNGNTSSGTNSATIGGNSNTASGTNSTVVGGLSNTASGNYSMILGGAGAQATGLSSMCLGANSALADKSGQIASATAGNFASTGDAQTSQFVLGKRTVNATPSEMSLDMSTTSRLTLSNDSTWCFDILIVARRTDANDESAAYRITGCIDRNATAATTALVGSITKTVIAEDTAAWDVTATADTTNGALAITVTGEASKTIQWVAFVRTVETTG